VILKLFRKKNCTLHGQNCD